MSELEYCCVCDEPTGRGGQCDDSIYCECKSGPFCEECWSGHWCLWGDERRPSDERGD